MRGRWESQSKSVSAERWAGRGSSPTVREGVVTSLPPGLPDREGGRISDLFIFLTSSSLQVSLLELRSIIQRCSHSPAMLHRGIGSGAPELRPPSRSGYCPGVASSHERF